MTKQTDRQAVPPETVFIPPEAFERKTDRTTVYWLGSAGIMINSRGTIILIDPLLVQRITPDGIRSEVQGGLELLQPLPLAEENCGRIDAVLYTHADEDHCGRESAALLHEKTDVFHVPGIVADALEKESGIPREKIVCHKDGDFFRVGNITVQMTRAFHPWQLMNPKEYDWYYTIDDCTGFKLLTEDGTIWDPGDTKLQSEHLQEGPIDLMFMDFSDDPYHLGRIDSVSLVNYYRNVPVIPFHWGTFKSREACYCADPEDIRTGLLNPWQMHVLAPGEPYIVRNI